MAMEYLLNLNKLTYMQAHDIQIKDINQDACYEGYLWVSDRQRPECFDGRKKLSEQINLDQFASNPFIVEGFLYKDGTSISIKFVDGEYLVKEYTEVIVDEDKVQTYIPNRMGSNKLKFMQNWTLVPDVNCAGFDVLQPSDLIFVGFNK